jgi:hypothetical protein
MKRPVVLLILLSLAALGARGDTLTLQEMNPLDYNAAFSFAPGSNVVGTINSPVGQISFNVAGGYDGIGDEDFGFSVICWSLGPNGVGSANLAPGGTTDIGASDAESWFTDYDGILTNWVAGGIFNATFGSDGVTGTGSFFFTDIVSYPDFPDLTNVVSGQIPPLPEQGDLPWEAAGIGLFLLLADISRRRRLAPLR